jgi:hypothetical protein
MSRYDYEQHVADDTTLDIACCSPGVLCSSTREAISTPEKGRRWDYLSPRDFHARSNLRGEARKKGITGQVSLALEVSPGRDDQ